jgi:flagellar biosynthesis chaperone FliJ
MSMNDNAPRALRALLSMRERELDAAQRDGRQLAQRQQRLARNVAQLTALYRAVAIDGTRASAHSFQNRADYKRTLVEMIETQQAPMVQMGRWQAVAAQAVRDAQRRREGVAILVARHETAARQARWQREAREQAALALAIWQRGVSARERNEEIPSIPGVDKARAEVAWVGETPRFAPRAHPESGVSPCCK